MKEGLCMQPVNLSENINLSESTKLYVVWMGTNEQPKMKKHNKVLTDGEADALIERLTPIFKDIIYTKEEVK